MKKLFFFLFLLVSVQAVFAQDPTNERKVTRKGKKEKTFTLNDIRSRKILDLGDLNTSCSTKKKEDSKGVKAVLIKDLLDSVRFQYASPLELNPFYFRFEASDGYTLVYSFNEIYNTESGNHLYIVTEKDGKTMEQMDNRILILTTSDLKTGNRNMPNLARIVVCKAE